jgi:paraquat-inducible protein B
MSSGPDDTEHGDPGGPQRVQAGVRHGWWPGWIWAIPVTALLIVIWLGARYLLAGGTDITIRFIDAHGMKKQNTDVLLRGTNVGHVTGIKLTGDGTAVIVTAAIDEQAKKFLRTGTRFWLQGAEPSLTHLSSIGSLLSGPSIVMSPEPGQKSRHFIGLERKPIAPSAGERPILYEIALGGDAGSLPGGAPVLLRGFTVGEVRDVGFGYDPATGAISTPATLALYPSLFHIEGVRAAPTATQAGLTNTAQEIKQAARAVRSLADCLDQHPAALIRGRGDAP